MKTLKAVKQGLQYFEGHGNVPSYNVTVKGHNSREHARAAAEQMTKDCPNRTADHWHQCILRREEFDTFTIFTFAEII